ncbi:MAG: 2-amino-4-hydroxy-6-hydroxymethyldihydropteridine diphosphokinase [Alteripontixanthobacter sp.]
MRGSLTHRYLIALGSNIRHPRYGPPRKVVQAAAHDLGRGAGALAALSPIVASAPLGPSRRTYANACASIESALTPLEMLSVCQRIERDFGRKRSGRRWGARVLDLDIVLWSGGAFEAPDLIIPHLEFRGRAFVLVPASIIAGDWRDPVSGLTVNQIAKRNLINTHRYL